MAKKNSPPRPKREKLTETAAELKARLQLNSDELRASLPRGPGGDALLSQQLADALAMLVREGMPLEGACRVVGVARKTLGTWIAAGVAAIDAGKTTPEAKLAWTLEASLGDQERALVGLVMREAEKDGQVALGVLAVRRPDHWAPAASAPPDARALYAAMSEVELRAEVARLLNVAAKALPPAPPPEEKTP
jgi:hypothetical protein